jgi:hypothetical protein
MPLFGVVEERQVGIRGTPTTVAAADISHVAHVRIAGSRILRYYCPSFY